MQISLNIPANRAALTAALSGLVAVNRVYLSEHPRTPPLYRAGVRYVAELKKREKWLTIPQVIAAGKGDCEDLACWRAAELQALGIGAKAEVIRSGPKLFHAIVRLPDGSVEDPSVKLGMKKRRRR